MYEQVNELPLSQALSLLSMISSAEETLLAAAAAVKHSLTPCDDDMNVLNFQINTWQSMDNRNVKNSLFRFL